MSVSVWVSAWVIESIGDWLNEWVHERVCEMFFTFLEIRHCYCKILKVQKYFIMIHQRCISEQKDNFYIINLYLDKEVKTCLTEEFHSCMTSRMIRTDFIFTPLSIAQWRQAELRRLEFLFSDLCAILVKAWLATHKSFFSCLWIHIHPVSLDIAETGVW